MKKENLVILKAKVGEFTHGHSTFKPFVYYRCLPDMDKDRLIGYIIFGEWFSIEDYNQFFDLVYDRIMADFHDLGLFDSDSKVISKTAFKKRANIQTYTNGRANGVYHIWYIRDSRERIYGFYPSQGNQRDNLSECYEFLLQIISGNMEPIDEEDVCFGNSGIPLDYRKLSIR